MKAGRKNETSGKAFILRDKRSPSPNPDYRKPNPKPEKKAGESNLGLLKVRKETIEKTSLIESKKRFKKVITLNNAKKNMLFCTFLLKQKEKH